MGFHGPPNRPLTSLLALLMLPISILAQCPFQLDQQYCVCAPSIYEPVTILCDGAGSLTNVLNSISSARNSQIDSLVISNTPINSLQANAFQGFTIIRLVMNKNRLRSIDTRAFQGQLLDSLLELDLQGNDLGQVPTESLAPLRNLRKLYLGNNGIGSLPSGTFDNWASKDFMIKLDLSENKLTDSGLGVGGSSAFRELRNLEELSLETNSLRQIPTSALSTQRFSLINLNLGLNNITEVPMGALDFPNLESLSLEFNGINYIRPEAFKLIPSLLYLYLTGNRFPQWYPEMFRYINSLKILGIGETPIKVIPANAFQYIPSLMRLEMSEAAVDTIQPNAFQQTPEIQSIILNNNKLTSIPVGMFSGLSKLNTLDLQGNRLSDVENGAWANLPALRNLDISNNQLKTLQPNTFRNTFLPTPQIRVLYCCENPWVCDNRITWFRDWLRQNIDQIAINKPNCFAVCKEAPPYFPPNMPLTDPDPEPPITTATPAPIVEVAESIELGWIILIVIMVILLISICLLAFVRYFVSKKHKEEKEVEEEEIVKVSGSTIAASQYGETRIAAPSAIGSTYPAYGVPASGIDLDLPPATNLDERQNYWAY